MSKKEEFINYIESIVNENEMPENVKIYWEVFKGESDEDKPMFTDNGKLILKYMQDNVDTPMWKARDIAEGLFISSRAVSGSMRKLVDDGFVEKMGQNPTIYAITENGKNIIID
jgi:DNA-binding MarR family transcriptional regulator